MEERTFNEKDIEKFLNSKLIQDYLNDLGIFADFSVISIMDLADLVSDEEEENEEIDEDEDFDNLEYSSDDNDNIYDDEMEEEKDLPLFLDPLGYNARPGENDIELEDSGVFYIKFSDTNIMASVSDLDFILYDIDSDNPLLYANDTNYTGGHLFLTKEWQSFILETFSNDRKQNIANELETTNKFFYNRIINKAKEYIEKTKIINSFYALIKSRTSYPKSTKEIISSKGNPFDVNFVLKFLNANQAYATLANDLELDDQGFCMNNYMLGNLDLRIFRDQKLKPFFKFIDVDDFELFKFYSNGYEIEAFYSICKCILRVNDQPLDISPYWRSYIVNNSDEYQIEIVKNFLFYTEDEFDKFYNIVIPRYKNEYDKCLSKTTEFIKRLKGIEQKSDDKKNPTIR